MEDLESLVNQYKDHQHEYKRFMEAVIAYFKDEPALNKGPLPIIHSIKSRLKNPEHLRDKLQRKIEQGKQITADNLFSEVTDFAGVRILHLYPEQFVKIHEFIEANIKHGDWKYVEDPVANTWDPEYEKTYKSLGLTCNRRDTLYTSIHYLVKPNNDRTTVCCEIQVRTLFEEIWGEIDHNLNYPHPTNSIACKEQLKVLAKLVSAGTRLADSIYKSYEEYANWTRNQAEGESEVLK